MNLIPTPQLLAQISHYSQNKGGKNYCLFLLGSKAGLRVSEAVNFNPQLASEHNFYQVKSKGKERFAYVSEQTKKELKISASIELTSHTLRRCFATYHANNGVPMTVLQQALGHSSIRTTALYWQTKTTPPNFPENGTIPREISPSPKAIQAPANNFSPIISKNLVQIQPENSILIENQLKARKITKQIQLSEQSELMRLRKENQQLNFGSQQKSIMTNIFIATLSILKLPLKLLTG
ncbi:12627_t:CDS:2 [Ambispora gerdemannii]|uniref:12627_t:CDS:1 n=1 Tax=Ambispora gerdemannii TaxID=144530 RepID=A0A9N9AYN1_9GLOM|nr:12627_t:CDS:2 [Ambispora gerdemannii]